MRNCRVGSGAWSGERLWERGRRVNRGLGRGAGWPGERKCRVGRGVERGGEWWE